MIIVTLFPCPVVHGQVNAYIRFVESYYAPGLSSLQIKLHGLKYDTDYNIPFGLRVLLRAAIQNYTLRKTWSWILRINMSSQGRLRDRHNTLPGQKLLEQQYHLHEHTLYCPLFNDINARGKTNELCIPMYAQAYPTGHHELNLRTASAAIITPSF